MVISIPLIIIAIPFILVIWAGFGLSSFVKGKILCLIVKLKWISRGKNTLFVYSNSPNWQNYIEKNIIPKIKDKAVIINWSKRKDWNKSNKLELQIFKQWSGANIYSTKGKKEWVGREYNPIAIVFEPWSKPKIFKFWQPFKDFKHGKKEPLKKLEKEFFKNLNS